VRGAKSKTLMVRDQHGQVLPGFVSVADATTYLSSDLFTNDVVGELGPLLDTAPDVRIYDEISARETRVPGARSESEVTLCRGPAKRFTTHCGCSD
jgi:hypothetical protein